MLSLFDFVTKVMLPSLSESWLSFYIFWKKLYQAENYLFLETLIKFACNFFFLAFKMSILDRKSNFDHQFYFFYGYWLVVSLFFLKSTLVIYIFLENYTCNIIFCLIVCIVYSFDFKNIANRNTMWPRNSWVHTPNIWEQVFK